MKKFQKQSHIIIFLVTLLLILCTFFLLHCSRISSNSMDKEFEAFTNELFVQEVSSNAVSLHYTLEHPEDYGIVNTKISYGEFSNDTRSVQEQLKYYQRLLHNFSPNKLSKKNQLTLEILDDYLENSYQEAKYILYQEPLSPLTGIHAQLPVLLAEFPLNNQDDVDDYLNLLSVTPDYFKSITEFEVEKSENGLFCSDEVLDDILNQCKDFVEMKDNFLISSFKERIEKIDTIDSLEKKNYCIKNEKLVKNYVFPAYRNLMKSLEHLRGTGKNPYGLAHFPNGKSYYRALVRSETGSDRSLSELEKMMKNQIQNDLLTVVSKRKSISKTAEQTLTMSSSPEQIFTQLRENLSSSFPRLSNDTVEIKNVPENLEDHLSPAFYLIPPIDNLNSQTIYLNNADEMEPLELFTTLAHEGYPGHMYQNTYMNQYVDSSLRRILNFGGYTEGWATYVEMISYYASGLSKEQATIAQCSASANLGIYAYCDLKIHADGWTVSDTEKYLKNYGITDTEVISKIYDMILGNPANYLKYYVGYLEFLDLKKESKKANSNFSESDFHTQILKTGPAPFSILRKEIIGENKSRRLLIIFKKCI